MREIYTKFHSLMCIYFIFTTFSLFSPFCSLIAFYITLTISPSTPKHCANCKQSTYLLERTPIGTAFSNEYFLSSDIRLSIDYID